jgi:protoporphyrinogen oxidase
MPDHHQILILGAGMSGLAAGMASQAPIYEKDCTAGGICSSYYLRPGNGERLAEPAGDGESYRFEIGGGHWIFGGDPSVLRGLRSFDQLGTYSRRSSVFFGSRSLYVPYPLQNHLGALGPELAARALNEITTAPRKVPVTMKQWIAQTFGETLTELFFGPFHDLYTAGLWTRIAPQDAFKTPDSLALVLKGAFGGVPPVGYNITFVYPEKGLAALAERMAHRCGINYGKEVSRIDLSTKEIGFSDGSSVRYQTLISTLPLNRMVEMTGILSNTKPDPYTSVLVLNIGAVKGRRCPDDHWLYTPEGRSGFHRVGFYSNVDPSFLPASRRAKADRVAIYVERSYPGGARPSERETQAYLNDVVRELQGWGFIEDVEVADPTWIDVAYTWSWPGSSWKQDALKALEAADIYQVGRYGRWAFQGIADSIRDGFFVGAALKD